MREARINPEKRKIRYLIADEIILIKIIFTNLYLDLFLLKIQVESSRI